ncbi:hypothetical protein BDN72DRAFT_264353 [Pluteus cervinus]|uniref:Uncharacterized protein n=1 Tax=Pluteus cervinus TaxID=181527 RepID=A0ACD3AGB3_9AGAR|nr:hypothetical protein BDN72DRAFT_264353 [Pluteus cervinus]
MSDFTHLPFDIGKLDSIYEHMELNMRVAFAAATIYIYDLFLTLGLEIELLWPSKWCFLKVIYLIQRYLPLVDTVILGRYELFQNAELCEYFVKASAYLQVIGVMFSEMILVRRAIAVWSNQRKWWIRLYVCFIISFIPFFAIIALFLRGLTFTAIDLPRHYCFIGGGSPILLVCWIMLTMCDAGILIAMAIPCFQYYRVQGSHSSLQKTVFRDGILYIFCLLVLSMINIAVIIKWPKAYASLLSSLERIIHSSLTSRVILDIRAQLNRDGGADGHPTIAMDVSVTTVRFRNVDVDVEPPSTLLRVGVDGNGTGPQRPSTSRSIPVSVITLPVPRGSSGS